MMEPEASVSALVSHHPLAQYIGFGGESPPASRAATRAAPTAFRRRLHKKLPMIQGRARPWRSPRPWLAAGRNRPRRRGSR
jgi:hypothetical protein